MNVLFQKQNFKSSYLSLLQRSPRELSTPLANA